MLIHREQTPIDMLSHVQKQFIYVVFVDVICIENYVLCMSNFLSDFMFACLSSPGKEREHRFHVSKMTQFFAMADEDHLVISRWNVL